MHGGFSIIGGHVPGLPPKSTPMLASYQWRSYTILRPGANNEIGAPPWFIFSHNPNTSI